MEDTRYHIRIVYLDVLRIIAVLAVIMIHTSAQNFDDVDVMTDTWTAYSFWNSLSQWAVPVFVMVSGALFLDPDKEIEISRLYRHNILRMLIVFIVWSLLYAVFMFGNILNTQGRTEELLSQVFHGHYHLWYLFLTIGLYMITPVVRKITSDWNITKYYVMLIVIFGFVIPSISNNLTAIIPKLSENVIFNSLMDDLNNVNVSFTLGYLGFFVLGYYLSRIQLTIGRRTVLYVLSLLSFFTAIFLNNKIAKSTHSVCMQFSLEYSVNTLLESAGIFIFVREISKRISNKTGKYISKIGNLCFGIYLIHAMVLETMYYHIGVSTASMNPWISSPVIATVTFGVSAVFIFCVHKVSHLGTYIA